MHFLTQLSVLEKNKYKLRVVVKDQLHWKRSFCESNF